MPSLLRLLFPRPNLEAILFANFDFSRGDCSGLRSQSQISEQCINLEDVEHAFAAVQGIRARQPVNNTCQESVQSTVRLRDFEVLTLVGWTSQQNSGRQGPTNCPTKT